MTEEKVKKREWVKNAAIIFLSVLLVLTFFSNTFMNYSLPEVSTQYVMSGSINTKIRGSGSVSANENYIVEATASRKVETVCVKVGQTVNAGDILFILGESDSDELEQAKETLYDMELAYQIELLSLAEGDYYEDRKAIESARDDLDAAKKKANELKPSVTGSAASVDAAKKLMDSANAEKEAAQKEYDDATEKLNSLSGDSEISTNIVRYSELYDEAEANYLAAIEERDKHEILSEEYAKYDSAAVEWKKAMETYANELLTLSEQSENLKKVYDDLYDEMLEKKAVLDEKSLAAENAKSSYDAALSNFTEYGANSEAYEAALDEVKRCDDTLDSLLHALQNRIEADEKADKISDLQLADKQRDIRKQREKVAELSGGDSGNEVVAKVGGTIAEINVRAGESAEMGSQMATIELSDRGYTVSISVTSEQAKKVAIGDTAEVSTYWWGSQVNAVLTDIKNDAQSGGRNKFLVFDVSGDVEPGMNVDISIGQRSQNYDAIVPNSAVRSDSNGSFVLVLTTKSSPLGNRYSATRVDVQVVAKDDINSAVSGIGNGEYVITTASAPIEPGMLVRMAEG